MKQTDSDKQFGKNRDLEKYLKSALEHVVAAGHGIQEFSEFALERFGDVAQPHLREFIHDVRTGVIEIKGITKATRAKILGHHVSKEEREQLIRETAYQLAEKRKFIGGDAETDWYEAEKQVKRKLDDEAGLVIKGYETLTHLSAEVTTELKTLEHDVHKWLQDKRKRAA